MSVTRPFCSEVTRLRISCLSLKVPTVPTLPFSIHPENPPPLVHPSGSTSLHSLGPPETQLRPSQTLYESSSSAPDLPWSIPGRVVKFLLPKNLHPLPINDFWNSSFSLHYCKRKDYLVTPRSLICFCLLLGTPSYKTPGPPLATGLCPDEGQRHGCRPGCR